METIASLDIDAQKGFTPLCPNELPVAGGSEIVAALNAQATLATLRVGSKDAHPANADWATRDP
ncbi:MAG: nicotinamidase, partial [Aeromonas sp.]